MWMVQVSERGGWLEGRFLSEQSLQNAVPQFFICVRKGEGEFSVGVCEWGEEHLLQHLVVFGQSRVLCVKDRHLLQLPIKKISSA